MKTSNPHALEAYNVYLEKTFLLHNKTYKIRITTKELDDNEIEYQYDIFDLNNTITSLWTEKSWLGVGAEIPVDYFIQRSKYAISAFQSRMSDANEMAKACMYFNNADLNEELN